MFTMSDSYGDQQYHEQAYYEGIYNEGGGEEEHESWTEADYVLLSLVQSYDWAGALKRISSHPMEAASMGMQGRTPLHVACDHDAPAYVVQALLAAYPEASAMVGTSNMNPLHITCSSQHASVDVVRVLLQGGSGMEASMRDVDGDTPLHAACRCGAPIEVLSLLICANPAAVNERDYEGLTPLLRLWVRYFVILGDDVIDAVNGPADLTGELGEAWYKTELLLRVAYHGSLLDMVVDTRIPASNSEDETRQLAIGDRSRNNSEPQLSQQQREQQDEGKPDNSYNHHGGKSVFRAVHAAAGVDCPRPVVKIATIVHPDQLEERDGNGLLPLMIAASAPIFKVHDLSDEGYQLEDRIHGDDNTNDNEEGNEDYQDGAGALQPSVIQILLGASSLAASVPDPSGRLPLHLAIASNKRWNEGVKDILNAYPDALMLTDKHTMLLPFMLAAATDKPDLSTIFELLKSNPVLVQDGIYPTKPSSPKKSPPRRVVESDRRPTLPAQSEPTTPHLQGCLAFTTEKNEAESNNDNEIASPGSNMLPKGANQNGVTDCDPSSLSLRDGKLRQNKK
mmetsp:Transcript_31069/g.47585  ORF Transcript_31069/g.47585 Transcript_31069/m.47585 type:complete len:566 (-) Transcript_31069:104-1801(-)